MAASNETALDDFRKGKNRRTTVASTVSPRFLFSIFLYLY